MPYTRRFISSAAVVLALFAVRTQADAGVWFVSGIGSDLNPCNVSTLPCRTFNAAIAKASPNDWIYGTASPFTGTGPEVVHIDRSLTILGGYDSTFTTRVNFSIINGEHVRGGITIDQGADVIMSDVAVVWGVAADGGGIHVDGGLWGDRLLLAQNRALRGGGVYFNGQVGTTLSLSRSALYANEYYDRGGGLFVDGFHYDDPTNPSHVNSATLWASTVSNNISINSVDEEHGTPPTDGGGVYVYHGFLNLIHTTLAENTHWDGAKLTQNNAGVGAIGDGFIVFGNTLIADGCQMYGNYAIPQEDGTNVERGFSCNFFGALDRVGVNPQILPADVNGGPYSTITHAIAVNSPALDWADPQRCGPPAPGNTDQRGIARPQSAMCDIGAYERRLDEPTGLIVHPGVGFVDNGRCPTLRWDRNGRSVPNPCRPDPEALIRAMLGRLLPGGEPAPGSRGGHFD